MITAIEEVFFGLSHENCYLMCVCVCVCVGGGGVGGQGGRGFTFGGGLKKGGDDQIFETYVSET